MLSPSQTAPPEGVRQILAEQLEPLEQLRAELVSSWALAFDVERSRLRLAAGQVAYDPLEVIGSAGDVLVAYVRATVALERAGLASSQEALHARERRFHVMPLIAQWLAGESVPSDPARALARRAAALVGNTILRRASEDVLDGVSTDGWLKSRCPCCGNSPDFTLMRDGNRHLTCSRCDSEWVTRASGCLGCGATEAPAIARVISSALGYQLVVCNPCGRYLKEPFGDIRVDPFLDRALTLHLDGAAERRGLRL